MYGEVEDLLNENMAADFPGLTFELDGSPVTYLDSAATSLKPRSMVSAMSEYYLGISSNVHRGKHFSSESVSVKFEQARYKVAELINAAGNEIVFTGNATDSLNLVASGLCLGPEDKVIVFSDSHHSHFLPWLSRAQVRLVRLGSDGVPDFEHYAELLAEGASLVALTHCSNASGIYYPVEEMAGQAKAVGAKVVIDAAQSIPHRRLDVTKLNADFIAFSAHKMLGPTGLGILYGQRDELENLSPARLGGGMVDWVDSDSYRLRKIPHRLEAGTPNIGGVLGFAAAIDYLNRIGYERISTHDQELSAYMLAAARKREYLDIVADVEGYQRSALLSLKVRGQENLDNIARTLSDSYGIMCRSGHLCAQPYIDHQAGGQVLRISAYLYNRKQDIDRFFSALDEIIEFFC